MGKLIARHTMRADCGRLFLVDELIVRTATGSTTRWLELVDGSKVQKTQSNAFEVVGTNMCLQLHSSEYAAGAEPV